MRSALVLAGIAVFTERAVADPPDPVTLAPATALTGLRGDALVASNGDAAAIGIAAGGQLATPHGELFARGTMILAGWTDEGEGLTALGGGDGTSLALKAGARGRLSVGAVTIMPALWGDDSTGLPRDRHEAFAAHPDAFDDLLGLADPYSVAGTFAVAGSVAVHVVSGCGFAEVEFGTAAIDDHSAIAIDDLFGGVGVGGYLTPTISMAFEYRFVQQPTGSLSTGAYLQHFALALGGVGPGLRFRAGFGAGAVIGLDYTLPIGTSH